MTSDENDDIQDEKPEHGKTSDPVSIGGVVVAALAIGFVMFAVAVAAWYAGKSHGSRAAAATTVVSYPRVSQQVAAGGHDFVRFACAQCHGLDGVGGVSPDVPALRTLGPSLTKAQLVSIIEHGAGVSSNPTKPFMPVWHGIISDAQIADLVAYLHAGLPRVKEATPLPVPKGQGSAVAGSVDYLNLGCINCHGPNGLGGVPNPESPDTTVPPLGTPDFFQQFNTPQKIAAVIKSGSVIGNQPIVSMPHWGGIITQQQINDLIAYIDTLKRPSNGTTTYKP